MRSVLLKRTDTETFGGRGVRFATLPYRALRISQSLADAGGSRPWARKGIAKRLRVPVKVLLDFMGERVGLGKSCGLSVASCRVMGEIQPGTAHHNPDGGKAKPKRGPSAQRACPEFRYGSVIGT